MNALVIILLSLVGLVVLLLVFALFIKEDYQIEREIRINKPRQTVFDYLKFLKNQQNYSKWSMMDPNVKMEFKGTDGTVGFISAWDSQVKQVGKGEQEIRKILEGERIDLAIRFMKPMAGKARAYFKTESAGEGASRVTWGFRGKMKYPMNLMRVFMNMELMLGNDLSTGLTNLKALLEK